MTDNIGDEHIMYEPLLDNTVNGWRWSQINTVSRNVLQGIEQEDLALKDERKLEAQEKDQGPKEKS